jgi:hypothetical protein
MLLSSICIRVDTKFGRSPDEEAISNATSLNKLSEMAAIDQPLFLLLILAIYPVVKFWSNAAPVAACIIFI